MPYGITDYLFKRGLHEVESVVPAMTSDHILIYVIFTRNLLTLDDFMAWKSLEARDYIKNGWIGDVAFYELNDGNVIIKGFHFQSLSSNPLLPWAVSKRSSGCCVR